MRGRLAFASAFPQASISGGTARDKAQITGPFDFLREQLHGLEIFGRRRRIARFDDIHFKTRQLPGDHELLPAAQPRAGGLLTIAQCSVEYSDHTNMVGQASRPVHIGLPYCARTGQEACPTGRRCRRWWK